MAASGSLWELGGTLGLTSGWLMTARRHREASWRHLEAPRRQRGWPGGSQAEETCPGEGEKTDPWGLAATNQIAVSSQITRLQDPGCKIARLEGLQDYRITGCKIRRIA